MPLQIFNTMYADGTCPSTTAADGTVTRGACPDAYGMVLGTADSPCFCGSMDSLYHRNVHDLRIP